MDDEQSRHTLALAGPGIQVDATARASQYLPLRTLPPLLLRWSLILATTRAGMHNLLLLKIRWNVILLLLIPIFLASRSRQAASLDRRQLLSLPTDDIAKLIAVKDPLNNLDPHNPASHLSNILIPRARTLHFCPSITSCSRFISCIPIADTPNNTLVREYIVSTLKTFNWHVELDEFTDVTPIGPKRFANIIATKDPSASRRVVLSAHFDSKYFPKYPENQVRKEAMIIYGGADGGGKVCGCHRFSGVVCDDARPG